MCPKYTVQLRWGLRSARFAAGWLLTQCITQSRPAIMLYDSGYAANMVAGRWQPNSNQHLVQWARGLLAQVQESREVHWVHVKGHSGDGGNDRADELVQWGKEEGPYARLRALGEGEGESRFGAADRSRGSETRDEGLGSGVLHRGR